MVNKRAQISPEDFRALRKRAGFKTATAFAIYADVARNTVHRWENGRRKIPYSVVRILLDKSVSTLSDMIDMGLLTKREAVD